MLKQINDISDPPWHSLFIISNSKNVLNGISFKKKNANEQDRTTDNRYFDFLVLDEAKSRDSDIMIINIYNVCPSANNM